MKQKKKSFFTERFKDIRDSLKNPGDIFSLPELKKAAPKIITSILIAGLVLFIFSSLKNFFLGSEYFRVVQIDLQMEPRLEDAGYFRFYNIEKGMNIFKLDISEISRAVKGAHPEFRHVIISRKFPDSLSVRIEYKKPAVCIPAHPKRKFIYQKRYVNYPHRGSDLLVPLAGDGTVLPPGVLKGAPPVLMGMDFSDAVVKIGDIYSDRRLAYGIKFLNKLNALWELDDYRVESLDISSISNISIFLDNGLEIKLGEGGLKRKTAMLKKVLEEGGLEPSAVRYIDLRFKDVIINPR